MNKECVLTILAEIRDSLEPKLKKLSSISPLNQFSIALRFYRTGSFLKVSGDLFGVHEARFHV